MALPRRGRFGLLHLDGHTDFRHPGNSADCASVAGEDLAAAVGLHWPAIADIDGGLGPYFREEDSVQVACRDDDQHLAEASGLLGTVIPAQAILREELLDQVQAIREIVAPGQETAEVVAALDDDHDRRDLVQRTALAAQRQLSGLSEQGLFWGIRHGGSR